MARGSSDGMRALVFSAIITLVGLPALGGTLALLANQRLDGAALTWVEPLDAKYSFGL